MNPPRIIAKIFSLLACFCMPLHSSGQGTVNFRNNPGLFGEIVPVDRFVYSDFVGGTRLVGSNYVAELWYGSDANSLNPVGPPCRFRQISTDAALAGVWLGDVRTLVGFGPGNILTLQVKVWDISMFSAYEEASSFPGAIFGASVPFSYRIPLAGELSPYIYLIDNFRAFALVPEPSVLFLIPLLLTILLLRRSPKGSTLVAEGTALGPRPPSNLSAVSAAQLLAAPTISSHEKENRMNSAP